MRRIRLATVMGLGHPPGVATVLIEGLGRQGRPARPVSVRARIP